jgi:predicted  nucleic acid-binding Zn-ribbon protein
MQKQLNNLQGRIKELEDRIKDLQQRLGTQPGVPNDHEKYALWRELNGLKQTLETNKQMLVFVIPTQEELH